MSTTWIYLTWDTMPLAKIYILTLQTEYSSFYFFFSFLFLCLSFCIANIYIGEYRNKRSETELSRQNTTSFNFTSLEPSTEFFFFFWFFFLQVELQLTLHIENRYTFTIYSENDDVREQYGSTIKVKTLSRIFFFFFF